MNQCSICMFKSECRQIFYRDNQEYCEENYKEESQVTPETE
ncbi:unnamed protein product, partial [marine sediment metagenome]